MTDDIAQRGVGTVILLVLLIFASHCSSPKAVDWSVSSNSLVTYETELARFGHSGNRILICTPDLTGDSLFFTARGDDVWSIRINHLSQMMAVMSIVVGTLEPKTMSELSRNILQVVDSDGTLVSERDIGVQRFSFSPDGNKIAFISGFRLPEKELARNRSVGILDIQKDSITWILDTVSAPNFRVGFEIAWPNDGYIYLSTYRKILKVNEDDFKVASLDITGSANISPDGRFVYDNGDPYIGSNIRILEMKTGIDVSSSVYTLIGDSLDMHDYRISINWMGDVGSFLLLGMTQMDYADGTLKSTKLTGKHTFLIDVGAGNIVMHKTGEKLKAVDKTGWRASSNPFMVQDESGAIKLDADIMQKLRALKVIK